MRATVLDDVIMRARLTGLLRYLPGRIYVGDESVANGNRVPSTVRAPRWSGSSPHRIQQVGEEPYRLQRHVAYYLVHRRHGCHPPKHRAWGVCSGVAVVRLRRSCVHPYLLIIYSGVLYITYIDWGLGKSPTPSFPCHSLHALCVVASLTAVTFPKPALVFKGIARRRLKSGRAAQISPSNSVFEMEPFPHTYFDLGC